MKFERFLAATLAFATVCCRTDGSPRDRYRANRERATDSQVEAAPATRRFMPNDSERRKRGFSPWTASHEQYQGYDTFSVWKPPVYQLPRPYFIPVYGSPGRIPMYFPPQPININPGFPPDNPIRTSFRGPPYLPPPTSAPTTEKPKNATMKVGDRFNFDDDDRPVWGAAETTKAPGMAPTRPPRPPGLADFPPLVHDASHSGTNMLAAEDEDEAPFIPPAMAFRPTQQPSTSRRVPMTTRRVPTTTQRPPAAVQAPSGPSNCVWAVVSCCSASTKEVPENCFEQRGCPGPFWDRSPCESDFARAAIATALNYYNQ